MDRICLALNETMQIHELLNLKTVCMTTSKLMEGVVFDQDLKKLLERDVQSSIADIGALQTLLQQAPVIKS
jgi:similar to spore coat protein